MGVLCMTDFRHRFLPIAVGTVLALGLAACSSSSSSSSSSSGGTTSGGGSSLCSNIPSGPIKIANIEPLSGPTATSGTLTQIESNIEVDYFNAHDSVCGHKFALTNSNDKGDPATSLSIARQLVSQGNVIIVNDSFSSAQNQIQPYLMQQHSLVVNGDGALALFNAQQNPTAFSTGPSNAQYAQLMVNWAKSHNDNDIGILSDGTSFSVELAADAQADVKAAGLTFVKTITYSPTAIDLTTQLTQAKQAGIKTLFPTGFTGITAMVAGIKQIGWSPTVVGWGGLLDLGFVAFYGIGAYTYAFIDSGKFGVHVPTIFAVFGILQQVTFNGKLYWFREMRYGGIPFGPYVNRNHFAGFVELIIPVALV